MHPDPKTLSEPEISDIDFIQGANLIRNRDSLLARITYVEYVVKYLIAQFSRSQAIGLTYFCGSNGTWRKEPIEALQFSSASLVEDVEVSLRASISGYSGVFSPTLLTTELAPNKFEDWWHQRKRWAHGWFEAGALHSKALFYSGMPLAKILNWYYLIWIRRGVYSTVYYWFLVYVSLAFMMGDSEPFRVFFCLVLWQIGLASVQSLVARVRIHNQNMTTAANAQAERKTFGHRS